MGLFVYFAFSTLHGSWAGEPQGVGGGGEHQTRCGWEVGETIQFSLLGVCNRLLKLLLFHFSFKNVICSCLVCFILIFFLIKQFCFQFSTWVLKLMLYQKKIWCTTDHKEIKLTTKFDKATGIKI